MINEELAQFSEECIQKIIVRKYETVEAALDALTLEGIEEPEYDVIFDLYCDTCGHDGRSYTCGGRYHYDKNGILRKLHRSGIGLILGNLERPGDNTDCYVYDDRGRLVRAVECGNWSNSAIYFNLLAFCYKSDDSSGEPFWGIRGMLELMRDEEGRFIIKTNWSENAAQIIPFCPRTPSLSWWCDPEARAREPRSFRYYDMSEPSDKELIGYSILKASPEQREKLILCFSERKSKYFEQDDEEESEDL